MIWKNRLVFQQGVNLRYMNKKWITISITILSILIIFGMSIGKNDTDLKSEEKLESSDISGPGDYEFFLERDGLERRYLVHVPSDYEKETPTPLVFGIHGKGGTADRLKKMTGLDLNAEKNGYIVVYPDGTSDETSDRKLSWNTKMGSTFPIANEKADDVEFFSDIIDDITTKFSIDEDRIYATGISKGGQMAYRLGCDLTDRIAAVVAVAAPISTDVTCEPSETIPIMIIHGKKDPYPIEGGECGIRSDLFIGTMPFSKIPTECESIDNIAGFWAENNDCTPQSEITYQKGDVTCRTHNQCADDTEISLCTSEKGGHTWPSSAKGDLIKQALIESAAGKITYDISNEEIWEFFSRQSSR